jgi:SAM-dependent methyltransferase
MIKDTTSRQFFEDIYCEDPDPWKFALSGYELGRYKTSLEALGSRRFNRCFEPGCSIGVLTQKLAQICGIVKAMDISPTAVERARVRCAGLENVNIVCGALPDEIPTGTFDLIVFSEIGYYFEGEKLKSLISMLVSRMEDRAVLLGVHWLGSSPDHILSGDEVHETISKLDGLERVHEERRTGYRIDRWERR